MHILLVEDDLKLGSLIRHKLERENHSVDWASDGQEAEAYMQMVAYDLYILDWMVPQVSGLELCRKRRQCCDQTPILFLTARDAVENRVEGLDAGADDYLVKPFAFEELLARVRSLGRRKEVPLNDELLSVGDLALNERTYEVSLKGKPISLTRREFQILAFLMQHVGQVLSREQIMDQVWGLDADVTPNTVDVYIRLLRKKIEEPGAPGRIISVRGVGYKLVVT